PKPQLQASSASQTMEIDSMLAEIDAIRVQGGDVNIASLEDFHWALIY
ncbi:7051_t:CDS:2, partial [Racocetra fulgida]